MSAAVEEPSAPSDEPEFRVSNIMDAVTNLSSKSLYENLHHNPNQYRKPSSIEREEFATIKVTAEVPPVVADTTELEAFETIIEPYEELLVPVSSKKNWISEQIDFLRRKFRERPRRRVVSLRTANDVQEFFYQNSIGNKSVQPFNPSFLIEKNTRISKLIAYSAQAELLKQAGLHNLNAQKLAENGVVLQDLRNYRRYPDDLPVFFQTINHLMAAGFTRSHFDARLWTLHDISRAYGVDPVAVSGYFGMTPRDLLAAGVEPTELSQYNVRMQHIMADAKPFELLFSMRMNPMQLQQAFGLQSAHLFNADDDCRLSTEQMDILCTFADWNHAMLSKVGFTKEYLEKMCVAPQLDLESIRRVIVGSKMRKRN